MSQATMNISLPDSLKEYVKERVEEEHYSTPSDYVRSLIREDQKQRDEKKLEQMLLEGVRSGRGMEIGSKEWKEFRKRLVARAGTKQKSSQNSGYPSKYAISVVKKSRVGRKMLGCKRKKGSRIPRI